MSTQYPTETHRPSQSVGIIVGAAALCAIAVTSIVVVVALAIGGHFATHATAATPAPAPAATAGTVVPARPVTPVTPAKPAVVPSASVMALQKQLAALNYYNGNIDGLMGPQTIHAIEYLQRDAGLPQTGQMNAATQAALASFVAHGNNQMNA